MHSSFREREKGGGWYWSGRDSFLCFLPFNFLPSSSYFSYESQWPSVCLLGNNLPFIQTSPCKLCSFKFYTYHSLLHNKSCYSVTSVNKFVTAVRDNNERLSTYKSLEWMLVSKHWQSLWVYRVKKTRPCVWNRTQSFKEDRALEGLWDFWIFQLTAENLELVNNVYFHSFTL